MICDHLLHSSICLTNAHTELLQAMRDARHGFAPSAAPLAVREGSGRAQTARCTQINGSPADLRVGE